MEPIRKTIKLGAAGIAALLVSAAVALAGGAFEGTWNATDGAGKAFVITLGADGTAKATQGEGLEGTWKEDGGAAVITWTTGWTTKIAKDGDGYKKTAYGKGQALDGEPTNSSAAEKAK